MTKFYLLKADSLGIIGYRTVSVIKGIQEEPFKMTAAKLPSVFHHRIMHSVD